MTEKESTSLYSEDLAPVPQSGADPDSVKLCLLNAETAVAKSGLNVGKIEEVEARKWSFGGQM